HSRRYSLWRPARCPRDPGASARFPTAGRRRPRGDGTSRAPPGCPAALTKRELPTITSLADGGGPPPVLAGTNPLPPSNPIFFYLKTVIKKIVPVALYAVAG
ncbi:MAG TPA: hypothetical protein PKU77_07685, partial [Ferruginibacter sp.]|nr:hypothetical protein [Ferruginibacter sp.]